ncbi:DUF5681 domain-containing protein [Mesorhizobium sp. B2-3-4]|uniref:DUF5681 domain-containing protein n=1 Tax=Mesorhizobium sp. B2-3-4 TaxID=2589959 RepID=UPI00112D1C65|nr:DUF5681 domain-containing protein [Mesorhizobium sp. B2-3-4]TPM41411.1 PIN domain nuclease [Mesorhizobium sp. B2-3-4]
MSSNRVSSGTSRAKRPPVEHQFKPGQSGNPAGRPPGIPNLSVRIRNILEGVTPLPAAIKETIVNAVGEDRSALDALIIVGLLQGLQGEKEWAKLLLEQGYGKAVTPLWHSGVEGEPIRTDTRMEVILVRPKGSSND